jgi:hypothetical protein
MFALLVTGQFVRAYCLPRIRISWGNYSPSSEVVRLNLNFVYQATVVSIRRLLRRYTTIFSETSVPPMGTRHSKLGAMGD